MSGTELVNESVLQGVAKLLGLPDAAALAEVKPSGLWRLTQRELLDVAKTLGLQKVSRLKKEALLARVWEGLAEVGAVAADSDVPVSTKPVVAPPAAPVAPAPSPPPAPRGPSRQVEARAPVAAPPVAPAVAPFSGPTSDPSAVPGAPSTEDTHQSQPGAARKFDVGERAAPDLEALKAESAASIPWGYGRDRVTAMPVDPEGLYVYWEVTDEAIAKARSALGAGGANAYLCLRLYDISGRIFDGTNAHAYSDHGMDRAQRQWFFHVGKPTSEALVEIGLKSHEGYFVKVARSGRVTFPPHGPRQQGRAEWLTVRVSTGEVEGPPRSTAVPGPGQGANGTHRGHQGPWESSYYPAGFFAEGFTPEGAADVRRFLWGGRIVTGAGESPLSMHSQWEEIGSVEIDAEVFRSWSWHGDLESESWSAGPFSYPVALPNPVEETYGGPARVFRNGTRTHVVWGPWQVVIKGLGGRAEREVLGHWEIYRSWSVVGWPAGPGTADGTMVGLGRIGASELRIGGSELRLGGASERFRLGASELRLGGASERAYLGASERRFMAASELRLGGASERRFMGASELRLGGASEWRLGGASELRLGGASELRLGGASEGMLGASEGRLGQPGQVVVKPEGAYPVVPSVNPSK